MDTKRILVVDDEEQIRFLTKLFLEMAGHTVADAPDGVTALKMFQPGKFDVVITDFKMPGMRGDELMDQIRRVDPQQRIILMSGFMERSGMACDYLLPKPFGQTRLLEALKSVFSKPAQLN